MREEGENEVRGRGEEKVQQGERKDKKRRDKVEIGQEGEEERREKKR